MMYDLLIKKATIDNMIETKDIGILNGKIAEISNDIPESAGKETIWAEGRLITPGFVDSHMHFDKTMTIGEIETKTLDEAIKEFTRYFNTMDSNGWKADIKRRAREAARQAVQAGTTALRTHVNIEAGMDLYGVEALNELREELKDFVDIKITSLPAFFDGREAQEKRFELLDFGCRNQMFDFLGGALNHYDNWEELTEKTFAMAVKYDLPLDFHVDESDHPDVRNFEQIADLTIKHGYQGRVSCGHVTALNAVDEETARRVIRKAKEADLNIITLPSCNLYLMGRIDKQPIRRGTTRIREFLDAGVNISYASDNIRDVFRPIGNGDMLEEGLLTAQVAQMVTRSDLETVFKMGTVNPAKALLLDYYGLEVGKQADLIIFDTDSTVNALVNQATRNYVIKKGKVVARNTRTSEIVF